MSARSESNLAAGVVRRKSIGTIMVDTPTQRRLAAIMAADVVGFSAMMGADEAGTMKTLKHHRKSVFDPAVAAHGGRVVKLMGDGTLVEFSSVVEAVKCSLAIQNAIHSNAQKDIVLRIGLNLGDVIIEGDDIYGDGVNIAARLEPLAEPGGICVASIVKESVGNRIDLAFRDGGDVTVKNIDRPIKIFKWHPDSGAAGFLSQQAQVLSEMGHDAQPSIAVLPFDNMSGDPEQEYFSDGITEDIITDLSRVAGLTVIARNSSFVYKGKPVDVREVGRNLGVRSILEGSIRRANDRVRITAQLIDATSGSHIWAERYDRDLADIFAVQDEVSRRIVDALQVELTPNEAANIATVPTDNLEAHDLVLRARELLYGSQRTRETFEKVVELLGKVIVLDPNYAEAYASLAMAHNLDWQNNWTGAADAAGMALHYAKLAISIDSTLPYAHYLLSVLALWKRDLHVAKAEAEAALKLNPNYSFGYSTLGIIEAYAGDPDTGLDHLERAMRLDPAFVHQCMHFVGTAYLIGRKYEAAAVAFRERIRLSPKTDLSRGLLVAALGHLNRIEEAQRVWAELRQLNPGYSFAAHLARLPIVNRDDADNIYAGFTKAGLSE